MERYRSVVIPRPIINIKFIMFPTPKYRNNKKSVAAEAIIKPLLEFAKRVEKVKRRAIKNTKKNKGTIPRMDGLMKYIIAATTNHEINIIIKVGKKFFLLLIFFLFPRTTCVVWLLLTDFCFFIVIFYPIVEIFVKRL